MFLLFCFFFVLPSLLEAKLSKNMLNKNDWYLNEKIKMYNLEMKNFEIKQNLLYAKAELEKSQTDRSDSIITETVSNILINLDPHLSQTCKTCKSLTSAAKLSISAINLTINSILGDECENSIICNIYNKHFLENTLKIASTSLNNKLICELATSACVNNTHINKMLGRSEIPCNFCFQGLTVMKGMIGPLVDILALFKIGCNSRTICLSYFSNFITSTQNFVDAISNQDDIEYICKNFLNCHKYRIIISLLD
ncbi:hypothetical protein Mgra_00005113 [Meloidogyne graminicola]|uniref:Saposin B-type domain-containing protein n=1 Tax=Meloidogyne graminicola TaxID=189291 RepID=A0A8S9ZQV6_9BILA|nr:hypothetical protein Mgra_00005113 [Meloidogyne graminicola]